MMCVLVQKSLKILTFKQRFFCSFEACLWFKYITLKGIYFLGFLESQSRILNPNGLMGMLDFLLKKLIN